MSRLNKNPAGADWVNEPIAPDPMDPVKAWVNPGAVKPAYQLLSDRIWSIATGTHTLKRVWIDGAGQAVVPPGPPDYELNVAGAARFQGDTSKGIFLESGLPADPRTVTLTHLSLDIYQALRVNASGLYVSASASRNTDIEGRIVSKSLVRAWGWVALSNSVLQHQDGIGWDTVTPQNAPPNVNVRVRLAGLMATTDYHVEAHIQNGFGTGPSSVPVPCSIRNRTKSSFDIWCDNNLCNLAAADCEISFIVRGRGV